MRRGRLWVLDIADHRDRWEHTHLRATRDALVDSLVGEFGWVLTDIDGENTERNSDPEY